jgi:hypothetical protein
LSLNCAVSAPNVNWDNRVHVGNGLRLLMLLGNHADIRCYRAGPCKCCRWSRTMDILNFSRNPPAITSGVSESQRGAAVLLLGCPFTQVAGLTGPGGC